MTLLTTARSRATCLLLGALASACAARVQSPAPAPAAAAIPTAVSPATPGGGNAEALASFQRQVDERRRKLVSDEQRRRDLVRSFGFTDDRSSPLCHSDGPIAPASVDVDKSFWIHDRATLDAADFSLVHTLGSLAAQANSAGASGLNANLLFTKLMDTQNAAPGFSSGAHCSDAGNTLNGYPISCRGEGAQAGDPATQITKYWAIGLVNRLDLAHDGWRNCGEHRIVYGRNDAAGKLLGRAFVIFEGVLPNPKPGCRAACEPVAEFWRGLSDPSLTTAERAGKLHDFFYVGLPGFEPVVKLDHYTADGRASAYGSSGGGQIRTNTFVTSPWTLKEFRLLLGCEATGCDLDFVPTMVKINPFARLFSEQLAASSAPFHTEAAAFQSEFVANIASLAVKNPTCPGASGPPINQIGYPVSLQFDAGQSLSSPFDFGSDPRVTSYSFNFSGLADQAQAPLPGGFRNAVAASADRCGLSADQLVARAQRQNCAGCHAEGLFNPTDIGTVTLPDGSTTTTWPRSLDFVHASETPVGGIHALSPALLTAFLPERKRFMLQDLLEQPLCPCRETFARLSPPQREKAVKLEDTVTQRFAARVVEARARFEQVQKKPLNRARTTELQRLHQQLSALELAKDKALDRALKDAGITLPPIESPSKIVPLRLNPGPLALKDPVVLGELRRKAVLDAIRAEPPRRTVSGSFTVH